MKSSIINFIWNNIDIPIHWTLMNGRYINSVIVCSCRCIDEGQMDVNICDIIRCVDVLSAELNGAHCRKCVQVCIDHRQTVF